MYLVHRVEEIAVRSGDTRSAIGEFVLRERAHLSDYTIDDIAEACFASKASVTRFAKSLGYNGWRDFIRDFMAEVRYEANHSALINFDMPFSDGDAAESIVNAIADTHYEAIADTMRTLNRGALEKAVRYLRAASAVYVFGVSPNSYLGASFARKLLSVGKPAHVAQDGEFGVVSQSLGQGDCALVISYSGNNPQFNPLQHIPALERNRVPIIGITSEGDNYLRRHSSCALTITSHEALYSKIATFATEASIHYLLDVLFACYFARDYERNLSFKIEGARLLEKDRLSLLPKR